MSAFEKIIPGAFLVCVALTACGDRTDGLAHGNAAGKVDTVTQPGNMPAPQPAPEAPKELQGRDSAATAPLANSTSAKENTAMPEALQGNNHSSPNVGSSGGKGAPESPPGLKKSSLLAPKTPKIIWV
jgi:hypothetical protein